MTWGYTLPVWVAWDTGYAYRLNEDEWGRVHCDGLHLYGEITIERIRAIKMSDLQWHERFDKHEPAVWQQSAPPTQEQMDEEADWIAAGRGDKEAAKRIWEKVDANREREKPEVQQERKEKLREAAQRFYVSSKQKIEKLNEDLEQDQMPLTEAIVLVLEPRSDEPRDEYRKRFAKAYSWASKLGRGPLKLISELTGMPHSTAAMWAREAREAGYLPPAKRGQVAAADVEAPDVEAPAV